MGNSKSIPKIQELTTLNYKYEEYIIRDNIPLPKIEFNIVFPKKRTPRCVLLLTDNQSKYKFLKSDDYILITNSNTKEINNQDIYSIFNFIFINLRIEMDDIIIITDQKLNIDLFRYLSKYRVECLVILINNNITNYLFDDKGNTIFSEDDLRSLYCDILLINTKEEDRKYSNFFFEYLKKKNYPPIIVDEKGINNVIYSMINIYFFI